MLFLMYHRNMELMLFLLFQQCLTFLSTLMEGYLSGIFLLSFFYVSLSLPRAKLIFSSPLSKAQVQNPAALPSNPNKRVTVGWEPTVLATIIFPSE